MMRPKEVRPMYGTMARIQPLPGKEDALIAIGETMRAAPMPGFRASYLFKPDTNPYPNPTYFLVAVFDDEATYKANADSPGQDARYRELRALLAADPDWMDGTYWGM
jgi:heme-degrading monooxygenase HmoA